MTPLASTTPASKEGSKERWLLTGRKYGAVSCSVASYRTTVRVLQFILRTGSVELPGHVPRRWLLWIVSRIGLSRNITVKIPQVADPLRVWRTRVLALYNHT